MRRAKHKHGEKIEIQKSFFSTCAFNHSTVRGTDYPGLAQSKDSLVMTAFLSDSLHGQNLKSSQSPQGPEEGSGKLSESQEYFSWEGAVSMETGRSDFFF